ISPPECCGRSRTPRTSTCGREPDTDRARGGGCRPAPICAALALRQPSSFGDLQSVKRVPVYGPPSLKRSRLRLKLLQQLLVLVCASLVRTDDHARPGPPQRSGREIISEKVEVEGVVLCHSIQAADCR